MRYFPLFLFLVGGALLFLIEPLFADTIWLKSGARVEGMVKSCDGTHLLFSLGVNEKEGSALATYSLDQIDRIALSSTPEQAALLHQGALATDASAWRAFWQQRLPFLSIAGSDTGSIGLDFASVLLDQSEKTGEQESVAEAGKISSAVAANDWNPVRRQQAEALGLLVLLDSGNTEAAATAAATFLATTPKDALAQSDVHFVQGRIALQHLKEWTAAHPNWKNVSTLIASHAALQNEAMDDFLSAPVFAPTDRFRVARGLWAAASLSASMGEVAAARAELDDLVQNFPDPRYLRRAQALRSQLNQSDLALESSVHSSNP